MCTHAAEGKEDRLYLHQLVPVLDGFTGICQHGRPVLSAGTFSFAAYTAHPNHLVMANTGGDRGTKDRQSALGGQGIGAKVDKGTSQLLNY